MTEAQNVEDKWNYVKVVWLVESSRAGVWVDNETWWCIEEAAKAIKGKRRTKPRQRVTEKM